MRAYAFALAVLLAAVAPPSVAGELVARLGGDTARLTEKPCPVDVLKIIPEGSRGFFRQALMTVNAKQYVACWALRPDGMVMVVYTDGDMGLIPASAFKPDPGA